MSQVMKIMLEALNPSIDVSMSVDEVHQQIVQYFRYVGTITFHEVSIVNRKRHYRFSVGDTQIEGHVGNFHVKRKDTPRYNGRIGHAMLKALA